jgi:hypothetical protein
MKGRDKREREVKGIERERERVKVRGIERERESKMKNIKRKRIFLIDR